MSVTLNRYTCCDPQAGPLGPKIHDIHYHDASIQTGVGDFIVALLLWTSANFAEAAQSRPFVPSN